MTRRGEAGLGLAADFDRIAPKYDASRGPMPAELLDRLAEALRGRGAQRLLEIGVGTGRMARPLVDRGFNVVGVDPSRGMLDRARGKLPGRLVRGSAYALPFRDGGFDASLFVHVLHLIDRPAEALAEGARVGRQGSFGLVAERHLLDRHPRGGPSPREVLREELARADLPTPDFRSPSERETELLERHPPTSIERLTETRTVEPFERRLSWIEQGADRSTLHMPRDRLRDVVRRVRARVGDHSATYRIDYGLAIWMVGGPRGIGRARGAPSSAEGGS